MPRQCCRTWPIAAKSIFSSIGMIITQMSRPTGTLTRATSIRPSAWNGAGTSWPSAIPATMQRNTHSVSQRSKKPDRRPRAGKRRQSPPLTRPFRAAADLVEPLLQGQPVELVERQAREDGQPVLELGERPEERAALLLVGAFDGRGILDAPVRRHRLARPDRADLARRLVADREDEVELAARRARRTRPSSWSAGPRWASRFFSSSSRANGLTAPSAGCRRCRP